MDEIRARVARIFESHLPVDEKNELHPSHIDGATVRTGSPEAVETLRETIEGYVISPLKLLYIESGDHAGWLLDIVNLLRWFCTQIKKEEFYQEAYNEYLKVRAECWSIIHKESV